MSAENASPNARDVALEKLMKALEEYNAVCPSRPKPINPPEIEPKKMWASPDSFHLGYNMTLDCWTAGGVGKIPVLVVPLRPQDVTHYICTASVRTTMAAKLKAIGIEAIPLR